MEPHFYVTVTDKLSLVVVNNQSGERTTIYKLDATSSPFWYVQQVRKAFRFSNLFKALKYVVEHNSNITLFVVKNSNITANSIDREIAFLFNPNVMEKSISYEEVENMYNKHVKEFPLRFTPLSIDKIEKVSPTPDSGVYNYAIHILDTLRLNIIDDDRAAFSSIPLEKAFTNIKNHLLNKMNRSK